MGTNNSVFGTAKPWWGSSILVRILSNGVNDVQPDEPRYKHGEINLTHHRLDHSLVRAAAERGMMSP
jgi:hypothetical protein